MLERPETACRFFLTCPSDLLRRGNTNPPRTSKLILIHAAAAGLFPAATREEEEEDVCRAHGLNAPRIGVPVLFTWSSVVELSAAVVRGARHNLSPPRFVFTEALPQFHYHTKETPTCALRNILSLMAAPRLRELARPCPHKSHLAPVVSADWCGDAYLLPTTTVPLSKVIAVTDLAHGRLALRMFGMHLAWENTRRTHTLFAALTPAV